MIKFNKLLKQNNSIYGKYDDMQDIIYELIQWYKQSGNNTYNTWESLNHHKDFKLTHFSMFVFDYIMPQFGNFSRNKMCTCDILMMDDDNIVLRIHYNGYIDKLYKTKIRLLGIIFYIAFSECSFKDLNNIQIINYTPYPMFQRTCFISNSSNISISHKYQSDIEYQEFYGITDCSDIRSDIKLKIDYIYDTTIKDITLVKGVQIRNSTLINCKIIDICNIYNSTIIITDIDDVNKQCIIDQNCTITLNDKKFINPRVQCTYRDIIEYGNLETVSQLKKYIDTVILNKSVIIDKEFLSIHDNMYNLVCQYIKEVTGIVIRFDIHSYIALHRLYGEQIHFEFDTFEINNIILQKTTYNDLYIVYRIANCTLTNVVQQNNKQSLFGEIKDSTLINCKLNVDDNINNCVINDCEIYGDGSIFSSQIHGNSSMIRINQLQSTTVHECKKIQAQIDSCWINNCRELIIYRKLSSSNINNSEIHFEYLIDDCRGDNNLVNCTLCDISIKHNYDIDIYNRVFCKKCKIKDLEFYMKSDDEDGIFNSQVFSGYLIQFLNELLYVEEDYDDQYEQYEV